MAKNMAKRNLICFAILTVILVTLCFVNIGVPTTNYRFVGFANAITKDIDIAGSLTSKYTITINDGKGEEELSRTVAMLNSKFEQYGYASTRLSVSEAEAVVEMPNIKLASKVLEAISTSGELFISTGSDVSAFDEEKDIVGDDINDVYSTFSQTSYTSYTWGVNINLTNSGKNKLNTLTTNATSGNLYIFVGENQVTSIKYESTINQNDLYFYGTSETADSANVTALKILMGKYDAEFNMAQSSIYETAPLISQNIQTWIYIALITIALLILIAFFAMFGEFGYLIALTFALFGVLVLFFMQAIPIFILSFSGVLGMVLGFVLFFISNFIILNSIKKGYAEGKKINLATKLGFKNNILKIVDINVLAIIGAVFMYFLGGIFAQSFAFALAICAALNMFVTLLLNRWFAKWYNKINPDNAEKVHFTREANINEIN